MSANDTQIGGEHYKGKTFQSWDWDKYGIGCYEFNIIQYLTRDKNGVVDLQKALHYVEKMREEHVFHERRNRVPWVFRPYLSDAHKQYSAEWSMGIERRRAVWLCLTWSNIDDLNELSLRISNLIAGKQ